MKIRIYNPVESTTEEIDQFLQNMRLSRMKYLASDLLAKGVAPQDIIDGVKRAVTALKTMGIEDADHFQRVYTSLEGGTIKDCKMTKFGYTILMLNMKPSSEFIAKYQLEVAKLITK